MTCMRRSNDLTEGALRMHTGHPPVTQLLWIGLALGCSHPETSQPNSSEQTTVGTGDVDTCAVREGGTLWCWGRFGTVTPKPVGDDADWLSVSRGAYSGCAIRRDGSLWCWGYDDLGELGDGAYDPTVTYRPDPTPLSGSAKKWRVVSVGCQRVCAISIDGTLWCWGAGADESGETTNIPTRIGTSDDWKRLSVHIGGAGACAIKGRGTLWCWGAGIMPVQAVPSQFDARDDWARVSVGASHVCAARTDGTLWCWGDNRSGQLGSGSQPYENAPVQVDSSLRWATVSTGMSHTCGLQVNGTLWCWGENEYGQLGDGTTIQRRVPTQIGSDTNWAELSTGTYYTCAKQTDKSLWCWGSGVNGRLGNGTMEDKHTPTLVQWPTP